MPLTPPATREAIHHRRIDCRGYRRADGLWDIEGHLTDVKSYPFENAWRGEIQPGEPIHDMWLRLTLDDELTVIEVEAATAAGPFPICGAITPAFATLAGLRIGPGWRREVQRRLGGVNGCTWWSCWARSPPQPIRPFTSGAPNASRHWKMTNRHAISTAAMHWLETARSCDSTTRAGLPARTRRLRPLGRRSGRRLRRGQSTDGERMDVGLHQVPQRGEYHALTFDPTAIAECVRDDRHAEVSLAGRSRAGMAGMACGFVHKVEPHRRKRGVQSFANGICNTHDIGLFGVEAGGSGGLCGGDTRKGSFRLASDLVLRLNLGALDPHKAYSTCFVNALRFRKKFRLTSSRRGMGIRLGLPLAARAASGESPAPQRFAQL